MLSGRGYQASDPGLNELIAHTDKLHAPVAGDYTITLDGTSSRAETIEHPDTLVADNVCDVGSCDDSVQSFSWTWAQDAETTTSSR